MPMLVSIKLVEVLDSLDDLDEASCVFARKPWGLDALATIGSLTDDFRVPAKIANEGFEYFLEIHVAKELLEVLEDREPTLQERRHLLLYYAENDAFPDWVFN